MAMGMKMGNIDSTQGNESINQKKETETEKKIKPITDKEIQRVNEQLKNPDLWKQMDHLKSILRKKDQLSKEQQDKIDSVVKEMFQFLESKKDLFQNTEIRDFPDFNDHKSWENLSKTVMENFNESSFKILNQIMQNPEQFWNQFVEDWNGVLKNMQDTIESVWNNLDITNREDNSNKWKK